MNFNSNYNGTQKENDFSMLNDKNNNLFDEPKNDNNIETLFLSDESTPAMTNNIIQESVLPLLNNKLDNFIIFKNVSKIYSDESTPVYALDNVSFEISQGELVVMLGPSGAGKSTALNALGGMDTVSSGTIIVDGVEVSKCSLNELTEFRRNKIGFIFQFYNLIQNLTTIENVKLVAELCKNPLNSEEILKKVGLDNRLNNFPSQLSGGEQQRASVARALVKNPKVLLCDEPTGALDYKTGKQILQLLYDTCRNNHITVIIITHNTLIAPIADKVISFKSGKITSVKINPKPTPVGEIEW